MSLKKILLKAAKMHQYITMSDVEDICRRENKKLSNGERRLRELKEDGVHPVFYPKGYIVAYEFKPETIKNTKYVSDKTGQLGLAI